MSRERGVQLYLGRLVDYSVVCVLFLFITFLLFVCNTGTR